MYLLKISKVSKVSGGEAANQSDESKPAEEPIANPATGKPVLPSER